jgi:hypothetical protein
VSMTSNKCKSKMTGKGHVKLVAQW